MDRAAEYLYANEDEMVIAIKQWTLTPATLVQQLRMSHNLFEIAANPRLILGDEKTNLHRLAGGLGTRINVFDIKVNKTVT